MKIKVLLLIIFVIGDLALAQTGGIVLKKGIVQDSVRINDSIPESMAVFLPSSYDPSKTWPILFAIDMEGRAKQVVHMFREVAEEQGYLVVASNHIRDSLSITQNMFITNRMFNAARGLFSIDKARVYTAGFSNGAKFASLIPSIIKPVGGVISCGSGIAFRELMDPVSFEFVGIVGRSDFIYPDMIDAQGGNLNIRRNVGGKFSFNDYLMVFEGGHEWPDKTYLGRSLEIFTLAAMRQGTIDKDPEFVQKIYNRDLSSLNAYTGNNDFSGAVLLLDEIKLKFKGLLDLREVTKRRKVLTKDKGYIAENRKSNRYFQKESFIKQDYQYNLNDDVLSLNYNNLGWWNYQMSKIKDRFNSPDPYEKELGERLLGYLNALVEDNINLELDQDPVNDEALSFLWMVKTITAPKEFRNYLNIISDSAKYEDFGTALFYLEELLKNGYEDRATLYSLENTALLRITPEFNAIVDKYLKGARYDLIDE
jgi:hypothetical protein